MISARINVSKHHAVLYLDFVQELRPRNLSGDERRDLLRPGQLAVPTLLLLFVDVKDVVALQLCTTTATATTRKRHRVASAPNQAGT